MADNSFSAIVYDIVFSIFPLSPFLLCDFIITYNLIFVNGLKVCFLSIFNQFLAFLKQKTNFRVLMNEFHRYEFNSENIW